MNTFQDCPVFHVHTHTNESETMHINKHIKYMQVSM